MGEGEGDLVVWRGRRAGYSELQTREARSTGKVGQQWKRIVETESPNRYRLEDIEFLSREWHSDIGDKRGKRRIKASE